MKTQPIQFTVVLLGCLVWSAGTRTTLAQGDEAEVLSKLKEAKESYFAELTTIRDSLLELTEKRLKVARKKGSEPLVEAILSEQKGLREYLDLPPGTPVGIQRKLASLAAGIDKAYTEARQALTNLNQSAKAEALGKEQEKLRFLASIQQTRMLLLGTWKLEMGSYQSDFTFFPDGTMYHSTEKFRGYWRVDPEQRFVIVTSTKNASGGDRIRLPLNPQGTEGLSSSGGRKFMLTKQK